MKNVAFFLVIAVTANVDGMKQTNQVFYSEVQQFLSNIDSHGYRQQWNNESDRSQQTLTLNFEGRKQFIESVRSKKDEDHISNFRVIVPVNPELNVRTEFELRNPNNHSGGYIFNPVVIKKEITGHPYVHRKENKICQSCGYQKNNQCNWGLLNKLLINNRSFNIGYFAINVLRILKLSQKPLATDEPNRVNRIANQCVVNTAIEIAAMILTTERARDEYSLLISYIEFYKLKHTDASNQGEMLLNMFDTNNPILRFPKASGGASLIRNMQPDDIYNKFRDMLPYSPYHRRLQQLPEFMHDILTDSFYEEKLEKLMAISENRKTRQKSKFKKLIDMTEAFFRIKTRKTFAKWKDSMQYTDEISEPEIGQELTLTDPYADRFDEYDENPLNPTMPGHHDHLFRNG